MGNNLLNLLEMMCTAGRDQAPKAPETREVVREILDEKLAMQLHGELVQPPWLAGDLLLLLIRLQQHRDDVWNKVAAAFDAPSIDISQPNGIHFGLSNDRPKGPRLVMYKDETKKVDVEALKKEYYAHYEGYELAGRCELTKEQCDRLHTMNRATKLLGTYAAELAQAAEKLQEEAMQEIFGRCGVDYKDVMTDGYKGGCSALCFDKHFVEVYKPVKPKTVAPATQKVD